MAAERQVVDAYVDKLNNSLVDYNTERAERGLRWIYDNLPRDNLSVSRYPRIAVKYEGANTTPHEVNSFKQRTDFRLGVYIYVSANSKFNGLEDWDIISELSESVRNAILTDSFHEDLLQYGVIGHFLEFENMTGAQNNVLVKQMVFNNKMVRSNG